LVAYVTKTKITNLLLKSKLFENFKMIKINRIAEVLVERGKKNMDLVNLFGVTESTVSRWVHNKQQPDVHKLYKIAEFLKIDIRELFYPTKWI
jgi:putative transcriptional regulator